MHCHKVNQIPENDHKFVLFHSPKTNGSHSMTPSEPTDLGIFSGQTSFVFWGIFSIQNWKLFPSQDAQIGISYVSWWLRSWWSWEIDHETRWALLTTRFWLGFWEESSKTHATRTKPSFAIVTARGDNTMYREFSTSLKKVNTNHQTSWIPPTALEHHSWCCESEVFWSLP